MLPRTPGYLTAALLFLLWGSEGCSNVTSLSQQLDAAMAEYDREAAPAQPAEVLVSFDLRHATMRPDATVHVLGDLTMSWTDPRITWNATEWGCDSVIASSDRVWRPDVSLLNSAGGGEEAASSVRLSSAGRVSWQLRYDAAVPVTLDLDDWPQDEHIAVFKFGSRTHNSGELVFDVGEKMRTVVFETGSWELMSVKGVLISGDERDVVEWHAVLRRRAAAHAAAAGAVLAAALLMLATSVALPPRARPPLCACASFTVALWLVSALARLPGGDATPRVFAAMCALCVGGAGAGAAAALVARLARCSGPPPRPLRAFASQLSRHCSLLAPNEDMRESAEVGAWATLAQLLDYVVICAVLLTVIACLFVYL